VTTDIHTQPSAASGPLSGRLLYLDDAGNDREVSRVHILTGVGSIDEKHPPSRPRSSAINCSAGSA